MKQSDDEEAQARKLIPVNLYSGISGDAEDIAQACLDRQKSLLMRFRMEATEAAARGDTVTGERLDAQAIILGRYFYGRQPPYIKPTYG
jgi:hypothetical protein